MKLFSYSVLIVCCLMVVASLHGVSSFSSETKRSNQIKAQSLKSLKFIFKNNKLMVTGKNHNKKSIVILKNKLEKLLIKMKVKKLTFTYKEGTVMLSKKVKLSESKQKKIIEALETQFAKQVEPQNKSFLDVLNFKHYYDDGYRREKVYYEKGLSTKWIIFIIILVVILILICCCILFCLGCFKSCFGNDD